MIEDYDAKVDIRFIDQHLKPYFRDLYKDMLIRSNQKEHLDKVTFIEYTKLPGIINDRLHFLFSAQLHSNLSPEEKKEQAADSHSPSNPKKNGNRDPKKEYITEHSFVDNFTKIFMGDLDTKMKFTFDM